MKTMQPLPFSLKDAKRICGQYQHIVGRPYDNHSYYTIDAVVVAPYEANSRNRFIMLYLLLEDATMALECDYAGSLYDVLVITGPVSQQGLQYKSIQSWIHATDAQPVELADGIEFTALPRAIIESY